MNENHFPLTGFSPSSPARILIADEPSIFEALDPLIGNRLDLDFELCTSRDGAMHKLLGSPYQLIICGVHLAEVDDFFLIKRSRALQSAVPLVVTAKTSDTGSAEEALNEGAFDVIAKPPNIEQLSATIRLGLWQHKLLKLLASQERAVERYQQHLAEFPLDKKVNAAYERSLKSLEEGIASYKKSMEHIEASLACLTRFASDVETQTKRRALERLETRPGTQPPIGI